MTDKVSLTDFSLANVWRSWYLFRVGKQSSAEMEIFSYYLEQNLYQLWHDLSTGVYHLGSYRTFIVSDNKRREISVVSIRDRVAHRLIYEYLVPIYDKTFSFDVWSCRKDKGLIGAINRTQKLLSRHAMGFVWRCDIAKFFDNVDQDILLSILKRKIKDSKALQLLEKIIKSYPSPAADIHTHKRERERETKSAGRGIPIGNLTSQIFSNIYLNELDRFVVHTIKPLGYVRYGDDFIVIVKSREQLVEYRKIVVAFLKQSLRLEIHDKNDILVKVRQGIHFLGVDIFPSGKRLRKRALLRSQQNLNPKNYASYHGLIHQHGNQKLKTKFNWQLLQDFESYE